MFTQEKPIHIITVALLLIAVQVIVFAEYFGIPDRNGSSSQNHTACTQEAKLCPDGSSVGRTGPNCEFTECAKTVIAQIDTSDWKTYRNEEYGFEVKYPGYIKVADTKEVIGSISLGYIRLCNFEETLLCLYIPRKAYPNSTFEAAALSVERLGIFTYLEEQIDYSKNKESCLGDPIPDETPKHVINGITFYKDSFGDGASGHTFGGFNYMTYHGGHCFQLTTGIALYGRAPSDLPEQGIRVFSKQETNEIFETFDQILSTFKFISTQPSDDAQRRQWYTPEEVLEVGSAINGRSITIKGYVTFIPFVDSFGLGGAYPGFRTDKGIIQVSGLQKIYDAVESRKEAMIRGTYDVDTLFLSIPHECPDCVQFVD